MANAFSKEERVAFEDILEGFHDQLVLSEAVSRYNVDDTESERSSDIIWRPQPYIVQSFDGLDQSSNFNDYTQLSVPANLGYSKAAPWIMDAKELRDALQENRLGKAAYQRLASDINVAVTNVVSAQGSLVVDVATAATGYDDVALCDSIMTEQGIAKEDRFLGLGTRDYNAMAGNLAARQTMNEMPTKAFKKAYLGEVAGFQTLKMDYNNRIAAAGGGGSLTIDTQAAALNYYVPKATSTATTGETANVDNRFQNITISSTTGVAAGDAFTIDGIEAVHHITKISTGQLKTFRVIEVVNGTTLKITPAIVSNQGSSVAEASYQNCEVTPSATAAITFLNTTAAGINPFWSWESIELRPGNYAVPADSGAAVMRATTENGLNVVMTKFFDINTYKIKYRLDVLFGVTNLNPEMNGILIFGQV